MSNFTDWDRAWQRWTLEGQLPPVEPTDDVAEQSPTMGDALGKVIAAEAAVRSAREAQASAAAEKAKLEAELRSVQRAREGLPYEFEEIEELYRLLWGDEDFAKRFGARAAVALLVTWLLLRWRSQGLESVAGCVLMPLACAANDLVGRGG